ncbi:hypothetical protein J1N35_001740 [Gossypium stocksii]|uniref:Uncharacterized protein n=1 Tax=Gossypium stocksii TaxID=47602 RepID=A0A9D3WIB8_9ROSI|nr:hypothetical protein J1N35_001740 [Gossypium stocksii]
MKGELKLEVVISLHCSSENAVIELSIKFAQANGAGPSSTTAAANVGTEAEAKSLTTRFCGGFTGLLQSSYYDVPVISMGRHSSFSDIDLNFSGHYRSGYERNPNLDTRARHSVGVFDFNFSDFAEHMGYRRTDNLLFTTGSDKGTSNPLVEDDNEGATKEEDTIKEEEAADAVDGSELDPDRIRRFSPIDLEVTPFSELE